MATVGTLLIDIAANTAKLQQDMEQAKTTVERAMKGIESAANLAKTALGALGVGLSVAGIVGKINGVISSMAQLKTISEQTGASVETLSALSGVAKLADTDLQGVGTALQKLSKHMLEATTQGGQVARVFKSLGVELQGTDGTLRSSSDVMQDVARKITTLSSETERVAAAQLLFGKAGAQLLPFMYELAKAGELNAKVTTEQAEQAKAYEDALVKLQGSSQKLWRTIAVEALPTLTSAAEKAADAAKQYGYLAGAVMGVAQAFGALAFNASRSEVEFQQGLIDQARADVEKLKAQIAAAQDPRFQNYRRRDAGVDQMQVQLKAAETTLAQFEARMEKLRNPPSPQKAGGRLDLSAEGSDAAWLREQERIRKIWVDGESAAAQANIDEYEARLKMEAQLSEAFWKNEERLRDEDVKGWVAHAEAVLQEAEHLDTLMAKMDEERNKEQAKALEAAAKAMEEYEKAGLKVDDMGRQLGMTFSSAFEDAIVKGKGLRDVLGGILQDILRIMVRTQITQPAAAALGQMFSGTAFYNTFSSTGANAAQKAAVNDWTFYGQQASAVPQMADGASMVTQGGLAWIHAGEAVVPAEANRWGGSAGGLVVNVHNQPGQTAEVAQRQGANGLELDIIIQRVEAGMARNVQRGQGIAPTLERQYSLNRAAGAFR